MIRTLFFTTILTTLSACATQPEPCTQEWAKWKSEKLLRSFAVEHRGFIRDLRGIEGKLENAGPVTLLRLAGMAEDAAGVIEDFQDDIVPELRLAYEQCGANGQFIPTFTSFLREEGVSEEAIRWIGGLSVFIDAFQTT